MSKNEKEMLAAFAAALLDGFNAAQSKVAGITLAWFSLPLVDRKGGAERFAAILPTLLPAVRKAVTVPDGLTAEEAEALRAGTAAEFTTYAGQCRSRLVAVSMSQNPKVVAIREEYASGAYRTSLASAYRLARGKQSGGGRPGGEESESKAVEKAAEKLTAAEVSPADKLAAILSIFKSMDKAGQDAVRKALAEVK